MQIQNGSEINYKEFAGIRIEYNTNSWIISTIESEDKKYFQFVT